MHDDIVPPRQQTLHSPNRPTQRRKITLDAPRPHAQFKTPEEVASDENDDIIDLDMKDIENNQPKDEGRFAALLQWHPTRKQWIIIAIVAVLLIGVGITWALLAYHKRPHAAAVIKKAPPPAIKYYSNLTGLQISDPSINKRPVTGVMIENSDDARPQSGLDQAGIVFEAVAEGGITRFLALYQDTAPNHIGPIRSARPYYLQWCLQFDCAYAHVGGSPDALSDISAWGVKDMNEFYNDSAYERVSNRLAPHNVYSSISQLNSLETSKGFGAPTYTSLLRKADSPSKTPNAASITINPSYADFQSQYSYNATTNNYTRSEAGAIHYEVDASGNQTEITPKVVIAMVIPQSQGALDATGAYYTNYATIGSGQVYIFQDGTIITGTWAKTSNNSQITLTDSTNQPIKLDAGQTWFVAVGNSSDVSYK